MPALLKGVLVPLRLGRVFDHTFTHHFGGQFGPLFCCFSDDDLPVYRRFRDLKCRFWTRF
jgi:hypothetical protein